MNKCLHRSTNDVGDECKNVNRKRVLTGILSKAEIALFAFIVWCRDDSNSTVMASNDFTEGSSVLFGYSFGGESILLKGHRMIGRAKSLGSNINDLVQRCNRPSIFVKWAVGYESLSSAFFFCREAAEDEDEDFRGDRATGD